MRAKVLFALPVIGEIGVLRMGNAVCFDDELCANAGEVSVVGTDRMLAAEVVTGLAERMQNGPEEAFGFGGIVAKLAGTGGGH